MQAIALSPAGVGVDVVCIKEEIPWKARATAISVQFPAHRPGLALLLTWEATGVVGESSSLQETEAVPEAQGGLRAEQVRTEAGGLVSATPVRGRYCSPRSSWESSLGVP